MIKKVIFFVSSIVFLLFWLNVIDFKVAPVEKMILGEDITNSASVGAPPETPTPTATPTATSTPTATGTPTPTPTPTPQVQFSIFGYGPAGSTLRMSSIAVSETTEIDENGYFEFINPPFPTFLSYLAGNYYPELCFQAADSKNRISMPVCIPALPKKAVTGRVGPVILPPTISVTEGISIKESQLVASGSTIPNTDVNVFVAKKSKSNFFELVSEVSAFYLPTYKVKSDISGNYEFSLPTNVSDEWRIFASSIFQGSRSPKSNTLTYYIKPASYKLVEIYEDSLARIKPKLLILFIGLELLILFVLILLTSGQRKEYQPVGNGKQRNNIKRLQKRYKEIQEEYLNFLRRPNTTRM